MDDIKIIRSKKEYKGELLRLHKEGFSHLGEIEYSALVENFDNNLNLGEVMIALYNHKVIGFQLFVELGDNQSIKEDLESKLYWAQHPERKKDLIDYYQKIANQGQGGSAIVKYFINQFTNKKFQLNDQDTYLDALVVDPKYRQKGIGAKLTKKTIESKTNDNSIYVDCLQDSGTESIYSHMGFKPIIRLGPTHISGHSSLMMGFKKN
tara:strand:- start:563 stop:1186 length:624 start_codon:yes stop_codon:yes gene_type:complete